MPPCENLLLLAHSGGAQEFYDTVKLRRQYAAKYSSLSEWRRWPVGEAVPVERAAGPGRTFESVP